MPSMLAVPETISSSQAPPRAMDLISAVRRSAFIGRSRDLAVEVTLLGGAIAPVMLVTAWLVVWPDWLRTAQAQSWVSEEGRGVRHIVVTLNKSRTLRFDKPFARRRP